MLLKWLGWIYQDVKNFYTFTTMIIVVVIGVYMVSIDYTSLKNKKLKKEGKLCRAIGLIYLFGGVGLFVLFKIF